VICKKKKKIKGDLHTSIDAIIVVEDNGSEQKKEGCEEVEHLGETQVSEIHHHFCI